jgi:hypothetical protein
VPRYEVTVDLARLTTEVDAPDAETAGNIAVGIFDSKAWDAICAGTYEVREIEDEARP